MNYHNSEENSEMNHQMTRQRALAEEGKGTLAGYTWQVNIQ